MEVIGVGVGRVTGRKKIVGLGVRKLCLSITWHKSAIKTNDKMHWNAYRFFRQQVIQIEEKRAF